jgi:hypothetical protein
MKEVRILYETSPDMAPRARDAFKLVKKKLEAIYPVHLEVDICANFETINMLEDKRYDFLAIHLGEEPEVKQKSYRNDPPTGAHTRYRPIGVYRRARAAKRISPKTITIAERTLYVPEIFAGLETQKWFDETSLPISDRGCYDLARILKKYNYISDVQKLIDLEND